MMMKKMTALIAAPGPMKTRAHTSATPAANMISIGWKMSWNWGRPRSNSSWKVDSAISTPPGHQTLRRPLTHQRS